MAMKCKIGSVNKHGSGEWRLLALCGHKEILKNSSSLKPQKKKKMAMVLSKIQVSHPGSSWPPCYMFAVQVFRKLCGIRRNCL